MSVIDKINKVMQSIGNLTKDKKVMVGGGYGYLSEEKITSELHQACARERLVIVPVDMEIVGERQDTLAGGKVLHNVRIRAVYSFRDPDDDSSIEVVVLGEGSDTMDKTMYKAMTGAYKYALRQAFMISTGDDPDKEASATDREQTRTGKPRPPQPKSPPPRQAAAEPGAGCRWPGCDKELKGYTSKEGRTITTARLIELSKERCDGAVYCFTHAKAYKAGERPDESNEEDVGIITQTEGTDESLYGTAPTLDPEDYA